MSLGKVLIVRMTTAHLHGATPVALWDEVSAGANADVRLVRTARGFKSMVSLAAMPSKALRTGH